MNAIDTIISLIEREHVTAKDVSTSIGQRDGYVGTIMSDYLRKGRSTIQVSLLARIAEAMNYELVLRSRDDGFEFIIDE